MCQKLMEKGWIGSPIDTLSNQNILYGIIMSMYSKDLEIDRN